MRHPSNVHPALRLATATQRATVDVIATPTPTTRQRVQHRGIVRPVHCMRTATQNSTLGAITSPTDRHRTGACPGPHLIAATQNTTIVAIVTPRQITRREDQRTAPPGHRVRTATRSDAAAAMATLSNRNRSNARSEHRLIAVIRSVGRAAMKNSNCDSLCLAAPTLLPCRNHEMPYLLLPRCHVR